jgi:hypothetical protein
MADTADQSLGEGIQRAGSGAAQGGLFTQIERDQQA